MIPASNSEVSTICPCPVDARECSAASTPTQPSMPAVMSVTGAPIFTGGQPGPSPVILINPLIPCVTRSNPPRSAYGPVRPNPEMERMGFGYEALDALNPQL